MFHLNRAIGGKLTLSVVGLEKKGKWMEWMEWMERAEGGRTCPLSLQERHLET